MAPHDHHMFHPCEVLGGCTVGGTVEARSSSVMAVLIHPGAMAAPFPSSKKGAFNFASQRKAVDYYATAVKTLEVRAFNSTVHGMRGATRINIGAYKCCFDLPPLVFVQNRLWQRDQRDRPLIQPDLTYYNEVLRIKFVHVADVSE